MIFHINFVKENPKIIDNIIENFKISPARIISGIMIGIVHPILTDNHIFFNLISLSLWIGTALILKNTFKILINKNFRSYFF